jgi:aconitate hydratase
MTSTSWQRTLPAGGQPYLSLAAAAEAGALPLDRAPRTCLLLIENVLRRAWTAPAPEREARLAEALDCARALIQAAAGRGQTPMDLYPTRLLMQDHSGVPVLADVASVRALAARRGLDPRAVAPRLPVDLVVDHSVEVFASAGPDALALNMRHEMSLNAERFRFLKWARQAFDLLSLIPPGNGIVHQMHLERLAKVVTVDGHGLAAPDTVLGTDSHTPMINALGVLGWGIGGLDATAVLLGLPLPLLSQPVVGVRLSGRPPVGVTATDLALTLTQVLRGFGVVHRMVEFFGTGVAELSVTDRSTVANMAPEYGSTSALFPVDGKVLDFLRLTGRADSAVDLVEEYCRIQGLFGADEEREPEFADIVEFDLGSVEPSAAGPRRPQDRMPISRVPRNFQAEFAPRADGDEPVAPNDGSIAIAAITSCTSTSNQASMMAAGLLARKAAERGLRVPAWVKTSLAPGSRAVTAYLEAAGLLEPLAALGFAVVGYGCTTCIGNSGPLLPETARAVTERQVKAVAVLSGNRNFEGRIHQQVAASYLMSPPLVVAYALAGTVLTDVTTEPLGHDSQGRPVLLAELWPTESELEAAMSHVASGYGTAAEADWAAGDEAWQQLSSPDGEMFDWPEDSTYFIPLPLIGFDAPGEQDGVHGARVLVYAEHATTTDHISPAGQIKAEGPAGRYLLAGGVPEAEFNTFGARRGNHEVMMRGTFAGAGLANRLVTGKGGRTLSLPAGEEATVFDAAQAYRDAGVPVVVLAGRDYGMGSSRDWAAKGPRLLGVRAVLAESFERIHRSNLVAAGVLPLEFEDGQSAESLGLTGRERYDLTGLAGLEPRGAVRVRATADDGSLVAEWTMRARVETPRELEYLRDGGVLGHVVASLTSVS